MLRGEYPLHRVLHTYVGATAVAAACLVIGRPLCQWALRLWTNWSWAPFQRYFPVGETISWSAAAAGAFIGTYSHVFLDSIMHSDVRPFRPFGESNPSYHLVGVVTLHFVCIFLGVVGAGYLAARSTRR